MTRAAYADSERSRFWEDPRPFAALASLIEQNAAYRRYAASLTAMWRDLLTPLAPEESVLVIGHSGELETALVASLPRADHAGWGGMFGPCEGARLRFDGEPARFRSVEILREP